MKRVAALLSVVLLLCAGTLALDKKESKDEDRAATLRFEVLKETNGKPVRNAAVVMHEVNKAGNQSKGGFELKTDSDGKASFDGVPYGKLRVQVLAPGFQTFGQDYDINQPVHEIVIKLQRPQQQYSIYDNK